MDTSKFFLKGMDISPDGDAIISSGKSEGMVTSPFYLKDSGWPPIPLLCGGMEMDTSPFSL